MDDLTQGLDRLRDAIAQTAQAAPELARRRAAQFQASDAEIRQLAQDAHDLGVKANAELARRGLAPVPIPEPGTVSDSQVFAAASTPPPSDGGGRPEPGG